MINKYKLDITSPEKLSVIIDCLKHIKKPELADLISKTNVTYCLVGEILDIIQAEAYANGIYSILQKIEKLNVFKSQGGASNDN